MSLTDADVERIAQRTASLIRETPEQVTVTARELMVQLKCKSLSALYRTTDRLKLHAYARGKYRVQDVENAIARAAINANRRAA